MRDSHIDVSPYGILHTPYHYHGMLMLTGPNPHGLPAYDFSVRSSAVPKTAFLHPVHAQIWHHTLACCRGRFRQRSSRMRVVRVQVDHGSRVVVLIVELAWDSAADRFN
jgi:hypothetical protein